MTVDPRHIAENLAEIRGRIAAAPRPRGQPVELIAVSKRHPPEAIRAAYDAGQRHFGENYAQELRDKRKALADLDDIRWHFIGGLQSNKVKYVTGIEAIHTVDRLSLLEAIDARAERSGEHQRVLVEVNLGEAQKAGLSSSALPAMLDAFADCRAVQCVGLMIIPPSGDAESTRKHFRSLYDLAAAQRERTRPNVQLDELSMGMSGDFEVAIEEGATLVRVGTALFGARPS